MRRRLVLKFSKRRTKKEFEKLSVGFDRVGVDGKSVSPNIIPDRDGEDAIGTKTNVKDVSQHTRPRRLILILSGRERIRAEWR